MHTFSILLLFSFGTQLSMINNDNESRHIKYVEEKIYSFFSQKVNQQTYEKIIESFSNSDLSDTYSDKHFAISNSKKTGLFTSRSHNKLFFDILKLDNQNFEHDCSRIMNHTLFKKVKPYLNYCSRIWVDDASNIVINLINPRTEENILYIYRHNGNQRLIIPTTVSEAVNKNEDEQFIIVNDTVCAKGLIQSVSLQENALTTVRENFKEPIKKDSITL